MTVFAILVLRPLAIAIDLVDHPGGRKMHEGKVPLVGGLAIFIAFTIAAGLTQPVEPLAEAMIGVGGVMVLVGLYDDRFTLSPTMRLVVHLFAGAVLVGMTHVVVRTMGDPFGIGPLVLPTWAAVLFTMAMITGAVNGFNMLDGMDGLAGLNALAALAGLSVLAWGTGQGSTEALLCLLLGSSVAGFMLFNFPFGLNRSLRCFMGDAGSTFIGVSIGWLCAAISQMPIHDGVAHPSYVLWTVALPLFELWSTFLRRALAGRSPFTADAGHFHHRLQLAGFSVRSAFVLFFLLNVLLIGSGLLLAHLGVPDWVAFSALVATGIAVVYSMDYAHHLLRWMPALRRGSAPVREST
jgi:UDP-GlcNAc:undecaprenyl-phosphate GlcNAc-1-phosphate transferase